MKFPAHVSLQIKSTSFNNNIHQYWPLLYKSRLSKSAIIESRYFVINNRSSTEKFDAFTLPSRNCSSTVNAKSAHSNKSSTTFLSIYFLRKERSYTKLKYSRVPQYDTSSNACAAFLAGLLGFIISEKFGFELVDSADLYVAGIYLLALFFTARIFLKASSLTTENTPVYSIRWILKYFTTLIKWGAFICTKIWKLICA